MPITVSAGRFPNLREIWGEGPNTLVVVAQTGTYRIIARHNIRSGSRPLYYAHFERQTDLPASPQTNVSRIISVWDAGVDLPDATGETIQECLEAALESIPD
ncbi:MAG TPA: hypothetical protein VK914_13425 [bacterium]|jgi:hypothetical protein|nr:hypothetical protein [bacterium]